jgi:hypothetical protein
LLLLAPIAVAQQPTPIVPNPKVTPGDAFGVTVQDLCVSGYAKKVRKVLAEMKREVSRNTASHRTIPAIMKGDHLIPLELGGSNSIKNLWPECHRTWLWSAQVKHRLEGKLHELVLRQAGDLEDQPSGLSPQTGAYKFYVNPNPPSRGSRRPPLR